MIRDHSDHSTSKEPTNPPWERIHRFIWCSRIRVISDHWSWSGSSQRNAPLEIWEIYLADSLKTNLTKFTVTWVKRRQKAGFLNPRSSNITETKEKERRQRKSEEDERRRRAKSNGCVFSFYNGCSGDCLFVAGMFNSWISSYSLKVKVSEDWITCKGRNHNFATNKYISIVIFKFTKKAWKERNGYFYFSVTLVARTWCLNSVARLWARECASERLLLDFSQLPQMKSLLAG